MVKTLNIQNRERILEVLIEKWQVTYKGKFIRITVHFSPETLKARRAWNGQTLSENNPEPRLIYPVNLSFIIEEKIKNFHNKQKLKEFVTTKTAPQKMLKDILHTEEENKHNEEIQKRINPTNWEE
jgi:hypothetical protein